MASQEVVYFDGAEIAVQREAEATAHLTFEGTRDQYVGGVPRSRSRRFAESLWFAAAGRRIESPE